VLIIESGLFDMAELAMHMQAGEKLDDKAPGNVFYMYNLVRDRLNVQAQ